MKTYFATAFLLATSLSATAATLEWDFTEDPRVTHFTLYEAATEVHTVNDPTARQLDLDAAGLVLQPQTEYTLRACSDSACSEHSNPLWMPVSPGGLKLTIEF